MAAMPMIELRNGMRIPAMWLGLYLLKAGHETESTVLEAIKLGYRLLDGAAFYNNEASLGRALAASPVPREELVVTSKVWTTDRTFSDAVVISRTAPSSH